MTAAEQWTHALAAWAIPEPILRAAPESPWGYPTALFARRADAAPVAPTASQRHALVALPNGGMVLDVGCGAGAAALPLAHRAGYLVGVDSSPEMLAAFRRRGEAAGVAVTTLEGAWPDAAARAPIADVVVCHHVAYNVPDLAAFVRALTAHASGRVVLELTAAHPLASLNDLWLRFHGLVRSTRPTAEDAVAVLREAGLAPEREQEAAPTFSPFTRQDDLIAWTRRRLCLPAARDPEIADALAGHIVHAPDGTVTLLRPEVVTLWWDGRPDPT